jgi:hypothetical protein
MLLVSAMLYCLALVSTSGGVAAAADECLAGPNKAPPQGSHWYYHVDRGTQRKCWHLGDDGKTAAASAQSDAAKPEPQQTASAWPAPVDNAHAELVDAPRAPQLTTPLASAQPTPLALAEPVQAGGRSADVTQPSTIASRWPKPGETLVADNDVPTNAPPASAADAQAAPKPAEPAPPPLETARHSLADYLPFALFAGVLVCIGILGWAGIRLLLVQQSEWGERLDPHRWARRQDDIADEARDQARGNALLQMGEIPMFAEAAAPTEVPQRVPEPPQRSLDDEIGEIERLLAVARQNTARMPSPSLWDVAHDQPSASK